MFFREYLRVLLPLALVFAIYYLVAVPLLEPPKTISPVARWDAPAIPDHAQWWDSYFPEGSWQRNHPRIVKTDNAILLFQTRVEKSKTRWLFEPLTILIPQRDSATSSKAIIIKNSSGAEIEFKSEVEWSKALPPIESGHLLGEITIDSPADATNNKEGMHIDARDLHINKRQIWTHQPIHMVMGNSKIDGRELLIQLDKDLLTSEPAGAKDDSPFNGLDFLQLFYVDRVLIGLNHGGLWPSKDVPDAASRPAYATLKCDGSFVFQFHQSKATLQNGVHMEHIVEGLPTDTFDCHELWLQVGWNQSPPTSPTTSKSLLASTGSSNWKVERLEAFGSAGRDSNDHSRWLKLVAPGMRAEAQGQHLLMDFVDESVALSNKLPGTASREFPRVYLKRDSIQVWSPEVRYWSPESVASTPEGAALMGKSSKSNRLGALLASGGVAQMDSQGESWKLSWSKQLKIKPQDDKDLLIIEGSANVSSPTHGRFTAEQVHLWLTPTTQEIATQLAPRYPEGNIPQFLPDRMNADGEVEVNSPQLRARVENMKVWFSYPSRMTSVPIAVAASAEQPHGPAGSTFPADSNQVPKLTLTPPSGPPLSPLLQPANLTQSNLTPTDQSIATPKTQAVAPPSSPLNVTGKTMQARVINSGTRTFIDDLQLDGNFSLTKDQVSDGSPWPFTATGESMRLSQRTQDATDITIVGQQGRDAKVMIGSGWVVAKELKLMQSENQFWIDHPGELVIPQEVLQRSKSQPIHSLVSLPNAVGGFTPAPTLGTPKEDELVWRKLPRLTWGKRMTFDGRTARFGGGVSIDCLIETDRDTLWHILAQADQMTVDMEQPVTLRNSGNANPTSTAQVAVIRLEGNVDIQTAQTDHRNNRRSLEHMKLPQLDFMVPTQSWIGQGPGELWSRRLAASNPLQTGVAATAPPVSPAANESSDNKQCIHLSFMGRFEGAMALRTVSFYDRIEALIGPIASWDDEINVHKVERLGRNQSRLISDRVHIFDGSGLSYNQAPAGSRAPVNKSAWEVEAQSRVKMESNTESGEINIEADSLKYAANNDTVRIGGSPRQSALISRVQSYNASPFEVRVNSASMRLKTGEIDMQLSRIEGALPANMQPPGSPRPAPQVRPPATAPGADSNLLPSPRGSSMFQPRGK